MAYHSAGDWRSPGQKWVRTETGWQPWTDVCPSQTLVDLHSGGGDGAWGEIVGLGSGQAEEVRAKGSLRTASTSDKDGAGAGSTEQSRDVLPSGLRDSECVSSSSCDFQDEGEPELHRETRAESSSTRGVLGTESSMYTTTEAAEACRARYVYRE